MTQPSTEPNDRTLPAYRYGESMAHPVVVVSPAQEAFEVNVGQIIWILYLRYEYLYLCCTLDSSVHIQVHGHEARAASRNVNVVKLRNLQLSPAIEAVLVYQYSCHVNAVSPERHAEPKVF